MRLCRLLTLFVFVACGSSPDETGDDSSSQTATDGTTEDDEGSDDTGDSGPVDTETSSLACQGQPVVTDLTPDELVAMMEAKDFQLINVHVPFDGELPDTDVHIEFTETDALEAHLGNDVTAKAVLYCKTGPMSRTATRNLVDRGYCHIYDLPAGMNGWVAEGYTLK